MYRRSGQSQSLTPLAGQNQGRYKGLTPAPGYVKFSMWKRETEIPKISFYEYIINKIRQHDGSKPWIKDITNSRTETFGQVSKSVASIASGLNKIGFGRRDVLCMYCSNYVEYWLLTLAAWSCGGCVMPVNCELDIELLEEQLIEAKCKFLVCDDFNFDEAVEILENTDIIKQMIVIGIEGKGQGCVLINDLLSDDGKTPPPKGNNNIWDRDPIYMPFTSSNGREGTKGIVHTNKSILSWFYSPDNAYNHYLDQMVGDCLACGNYFFHLSGFYTVILSAIYGVTVYCLSEYSDDSFLEMISDNRIQTATLYPWQIRILSQSPLVLRHDLACLKTIVSSGGVLSSTIKVELLERFPNIKFIREAYGLNECGIVTLNYPREKKSSITAAKAVDIPNDHVMPIGYPNMYSQIKIRSRLSNEPVEGPEEQGEICIRSSQNFTGYYNYRNNPKLFDNEEFFPTGDLGYYDSQGNIYFIERIENLIHFWMYEVSPSIIESRLLGSNNIVDAACVGIPNKENGEVPRAFVVLRPGIEETEENLIGLMESRLQDHERIRGGLFFIESIPRDENWKVLKDVLQEYKPKLAYEDSSEIESGSSLSQQINKNISSKSSHSKSKIVVRELEKDADGKYIASEGIEKLSPRPKRSAKKSKIHAKTIQEDPEMPAVPQGRRRSTCMGGSSGGSKEQQGPILGSCGIAGSGKGGPGTFTYWMQVHVDPRVLESVINTHPAISDSWVTGYYVAGVGNLPRAYVILKTGHSATPDQVLSYAHARLADTDRLRGGIVFVEKLPKDPEGRVLINLDKYESSFEGIDRDFISSQPKVKN